MGSTGGKHCKSPKRNVRRRVVSSLKKQCLWTQNAAFCRNFMRSGGEWYWGVEIVSFCGINGMNSIDEHSSCCEGRQRNLLNGLENCVILSPRTLLLTEKLHYAIHFFVALAIFAPWRSHNPVHRHGSPISGKSFIRFQNCMRMRKTAKISLSVEFWELSIDWLDFNRDFQSASTGSGLHQM